MVLRDMVCNTREIAKRKVNNEEIELTVGKMVYIVDKRDFNMNSLKAKINKVKTI